MPHTHLALAARIAFAGGPESRLDAGVGPKLLDRLLREGEHGTAGLRAARRLLHRGGPRVVGLRPDCHTSLWPPATAPWDERMQGNPGGRAVRAVRLLRLAHSAPAARSRSAPSSPTPSARSCVATSSMKGRIAPYIPKTATTAEETSSRARAQSNDDDCCSELHRALLIRKGARSSS